MTNAGQQVKGLFYAKQAYNRKIYKKSENSHNFNKKKKNFSQKLKKLSLFIYLCYNLL